MTFGEYRLFSEVEVTELGDRAVAAIEAQDSQERALAISQELGQLVLFRTDELRAVA